MTTPPANCPPLSHFSPVTPEELVKTVENTKPTTCVLNPIPSNLVKICFPIISPLISNIIYSSLSSGCVPQTLETAAVTPILKKRSTWVTVYLKKKKKTHLLPSLMLCSVFMMLSV